MIKLKEEFVKYGRTFKQIKRNDHAAIYEVTDIDSPEDHYYEAIRIVIGLERQFPTEETEGVDLSLLSDEMEFYPGSESFGRTGACTRFLAIAEEYFEKYTKIGEEKNELEVERLPS